MTFVFVLCSIRSMTIACYDSNVATWIFANRFYTLRSAEKNETLIALVSTSQTRRVINAEFAICSGERTRVLWECPALAQVIIKIHG